VTIPSFNDRLNRELVLTTKTNTHIFVAAAAQQGRCAGAQASPLLGVGEGVKTNF